jgi:hypothetical protein
VSEISDEQGRKWALARVAKVPRVPLSCGHDGFQYSTCVVCAHELGRREGQVEAGAYHTSDEVFATLRGERGMTIDWMTIRDCPCRGAGCIESDYAPGSFSPCGCNPDWSRISEPRPAQWDATTPPANILAQIAKEAKRV